MFQIRKKRLLIFKKKGVNCKNKILNKILEIFSKILCVSKDLPSTSFLI